jgi:hypothetical protein
MCLHCLQDLQAILSGHALGVAIKNSKSLDVDKRNLLVDIVANELIVQHDR